MSSFQYINEKLSDAVYMLATGPGDVRARLFTALPKILVLSSAELPPDLKNDLDWIQKKLTEKNEGPYGYNRGRTLRRMQNITGSKIAKRIVDLQFRVEILLEEELQK